MNKQMTMDEEDVIEDDVAEPELNEEQERRIPGRGRSHDHWRRIAERCYADPP